MQADCSVDIRVGRVLVCLQVVLWLCHGWLERSLEL